MLFEGRERKHPKILTELKTMISTDRGKYVRNEMKTQYFWLTYWLACSFHFQSEDVVLSY